MHSIDKEIIVSRQQTLSLKRVQNMAHALSKIVSNMLTRQIEFESECIICPQCYLVRLNQGVSILNKG